jgi:hypothetical protein
MLVWLAQPATVGSDGRFAILEFAQTRRECTTSPSGKIIAPKNPRETSLESTIRASVEPSTAYGVHETQRHPETTLHRSGEVYAQKVEVMRASQWESRL